MYLFLVEISGTSYLTHKLVTHILMEIHIYILMKMEIQVTL